MVRLPILRMLYPEPIIIERPARNQDLHFGCSSKILGLGSYRDVIMAKRRDLQSLHNPCVLPLWIGHPRRPIFCNNDAVLPTPEIKVREIAAWKYHCRIWLDDCLAIAHNQERICYR